MLRHDAGLEAYARISAVPRRARSPRLVSHQSNVVQYTYSIRLVAIAAARLR